MIKVSNLVKYYGKTKIIDNISFDINEGEIFSIVGHSGAGKSTLLRCINGLEDYQDGNLLVNNKEVSNIKGDELRKFRKNIGMIFQNFALMSRKNVYENVAMPLRFWGYDNKYIDKKVKDLLKLVGIANKSLSYPNQLSGGQKQRVAIARALALEPKILLSDEATSALDPNITRQILRLLRKINEELKITIVLVTHQMEVVKEISNRAILLNRGKIVNYGKIEELFLNPNKEMKEFLGYEEILPTKGINIKLFFSKDAVFQCLITNMARKLDMDFNIIWGQLEKLNDSVLGNLIINIQENQKEPVIKYLKASGIIWEIA